MKRVQTHLLFTLLVCVSLAVAACGGATAGSPSGGGSSATTPTATSKPKPTAVPEISVAFCQNIMTVAQANQIMHPPTPATKIRVDSPASGGGSCNYEYKLYLSVVTVAFTQYPGGNAQSFLSTLAARSVASVNPSIGKATTTSVTGVGDAAVFLTLSMPINKQAILHVVYGAVVITCLNPNVGSSSFATQQTALTQVCQQYISHL